MSVTELWTPERVEQFAIRKNLRSLSASGIDGMWLKDILTKLCYHPESAIKENDKLTLEGYNFLDKDGKLKAVVRKLFLSNSY
jgi:hypothetical protein